MLRRVVAGALITVGLLAAGCSDDDADEGGTTTTESTTTTTEDWTVPEQIDEEYVERVLTELYRLPGDGLRSSGGGRRRVHGTGRRDPPCCVREESVAEQFIEDEQQEGRD